MTDISGLPKQSFYNAVLESAIDSSQTTGIIPSKLFGFTFDGTTLYYLSLLDGDNTETISFTNQNGTTKELTGVTRGVTDISGGSGTAYSHGAGIGITMSDPVPVWDEVRTAVNSKADRAGDTFSGAVNFSGTDHQGITVISLTTAERDALGAITDGAIIYNSTEGEFQGRQGGAWITIESGSVQPNASETVAGKVQLATNAEMGTGTSVGSTGARLIPPNDQLVKTSAGAGDENKLAVLNASGQFDSSFVDAVQDADFTAKGDVLVGTGVGTKTALNVGSDDDIIVADSAEASGLNYRQPFKFASGRATYTPAVGTQQISHNLNVLPQIIKITAFAIDTVGVQDDGLTQSIGTYIEGGTSQSVQNAWKVGDTEELQDGDSANFIRFLAATPPDADIGIANISATTTTTFTINWTTADSRLGIVHLLWEVYG